MVKNMEHLRPTVIRGSELTGFCPPRHSGTENHQLLDGSITNGKVSVFHGRMEYGGEAEEHFHQVSSQFLHVLSGVCRVSFDDGASELRSGDSVFIPAGARHQIQIVSATGVRLINVYHPALDPNDMVL